MLKQKLTHPMLNLIQNNLERMRYESQPVQVGPYAYEDKRKKEIICKFIAISYMMPSI